MVIWISEWVSIFKYKANILNSSQVVNKPLVSNTVTSHVNVSVINQQANGVARSDDAVEDRRCVVVLLFVVILIDGNTVRYLKEER